jgi:hypothetical protein
MARQAAGDGGAFEVATFVQFATNDDGSVDIRALDRFSASAWIHFAPGTGHEVMLVSASRCSEGNVDRQARAGYL